jgi:ATP-dependent RNA helicase DDX27
LDNIRTNIDGSKGNIWNFNSQLSKDKKKSDSLFPLSGEETNDTHDEIPEFTIQQRVMKYLRINNVQVPEEMKNLDAEDKLELEFQVPVTNAKEHYDKEDLIQFHELNLSKPLVRACSELDYEHPTVIQRMAIPAIAEGHDILAHSVTGSGKTAAYLLPILQKYLQLRMVNNVEINKLRYLILQPTRELAAQCHSMLQSLSKYMPVSFKTCAVFGGSSLRDQKRQISFDSPDVIVATTGRLIDHIKNTRGFSLEDVEVLVLDEADRLLEMGFKDELMQIIGHCKSNKRQTLMVSATLN